MSDASIKPVRSIALMNQKGGVGKTTTAVSLAAGIARAGRSVLLVDLDPQSHSSLHLGVQKQDATAYDLLLDPAMDPDQVIVNAREHLDLLPSETDLAAVESELASEPDRQSRLGHVLDKVRDRYEFVIVDCPPSLGVLTINGLAAVREVIIPMQAQFLALQGVGKLLETVQLVGLSVNPKLRVSGIVLCMFDSQTTHAKEVVTDLSEFFERSRDADVPWRSARVLMPPIRRNIKLAECPSFGQTIFEYAPQAPGAEDYGKLAERLIAEWDALQERRSRDESEANSLEVDPGQQDQPVPEIITRSSPSALEPAE